MLAKLELVFDNKPLTVYINLQNKFDTLANGKNLTGYHKIKEVQLQQMQSSSVKIVNYDYKAVADLYKTAIDIEHF